MTAPLLLQFFRYRFKQLIRMGPLLFHGTASLHYDSAIGWDIAGRCVSRCSHTISYINGDKIKSIILMPKNGAISPPPPKISRPRDSGRSAGPAGYFPLFRAKGNGARIIRGLILTAESIADVGL